MNSLERSLTVINGGIPDRVPVSLHNFLAVGQFIGCNDIGALVKDGKLMAEAQIACWREVGHDMLQLENGVAALAESIGAEVRYTATEPPHVAEPILKSLEDAANLKLPDPEKDLPLCENLESTRIVCKELGDKAFVCGRADQGPLALAAAVRGVENLIFDIMDAEEDPEKEKQLRAFFEFCGECSIIYGLAQLNAGAHGTCIGGYGISTISPSVFRKYEQPLEKVYVDRIRPTGKVPFLHICGDELPILEDMIATGAPVLELDPLTPMADAKRIVAGRSTLLGFVDPANVMGMGSASLVRQHCEEALRVLAPGGGFILSPGCALPIETPAENMKAMVEAAKARGVYGGDGRLS